MADVMFSGRASAQPASANVNLSVKATLRVEVAVVRAADRPPKGALRLLDYALPRDIREELIGDLEEDYRTRMLARYSRREAKFRFWWEAIRAVAPLLRRAVLRWSLFAAIAKAAGWLWEKLGS